MTTPPDNTFMKFAKTFMKAKAYHSHVYLLKIDTGCSGVYYKIGIATDIQKRINQLQTGNPFKIELLAKCEAPRFVVEDLERSLHGIMSWFNVHGEWFKLPEHALNRVLKIFEERNVTL